MSKTVATRTIRIIGGKPDKHWYGHKFGQMRTVIPSKDPRFWLDFTTKSLILKRHCRDLSKKPVKTGGLYTHYKGGEYRVLEQAIEENSINEVVVYKSLRTGVVFVRSRKLFTDSVMVAGKREPRFMLYWLEK